jgi:hypothetical protein
MTTAHVGGIAVSTVAPPPATSSTRYRQTYENRTGSSIVNEYVGLHRRSAIALELSGGVEKRSFGVAGNESPRRPHSPMRRR